jgi:hypothetical protein
VFVVVVVVVFSDPVYPVSLLSLPVPVSLFSLPVPVT